MDGSAGIFCGHFMNQAGRKKYRLLLSMTLVMPPQMQRVQLGNALEVLVCIPVILGPLTVDVLSGGG